MLSSADEKKSAFHRERLGIRWALRHFKPYLIGKEFLIRTDHKPLTSLQAGRVDVLDPVAADILQFAPFTVQYLPGPKMPADYICPGSMPFAPQKSPEMALPRMNHFHILHTNRALSCPMKFFAPRSQQTKHLKQ